MTFKLSQRSLNNLKGVDERLQEVVHYAIGVSKIDFGVICGLRTVEEQKALVAKGASKTMNSKHLTGDAVDLMAFISGRGSWELNLYDEIADAMREGGEKVGINLRWGAAWHKPLTGWNGTAEALMNEYIDLAPQPRKTAVSGLPSLRTVGLMITGDDIPEQPAPVRGPRTLILRNLLWLPLVYFLYGP
jgi:peptidoglycan LD-endopeptidase CwlK